MLDSGEEKIVGWHCSCWCAYSVVSCGFESSVLDAVYLAVASGPLAAVVRKFVVLA